MFSARTVSCCVARSLSEVPDSPPVTRSPTPVERDDVVRSSTPIPSAPSLVSSSSPVRASSPAPSSSPVGSRVRMPSPPVLQLGEPVIPARALSDDSKKRTRSEEEPCEPQKKKKAVTFSEEVVDIEDGEIVDP